MELGVGMREKLDLSFAEPQRTLNPRFQMIIRLNHRQGAHDQRHFSFKDAKDYLHHVGRPLIPFSLSTHPHYPHGRMWPSYLKISHRKEPFLFFACLSSIAIPFHAHHSSFDMQLNTRAGLQLNLDDFVPSQDGPVRQQLCGEASLDLVPEYGQFRGLSKLELTGRTYKHSLD